MLLDDKIYLGTSTRPEYLALKFANRHGLVTGATGTGKTVSLQIMAEGFSRAGVPVFCADVKGDLSGISMIGTPSDGLTKRSAPRAAQPETVKAYRLLLDGKVIATVTDNYLRKRVHTLAAPVTGKKLELEVTATHGAPAARVYEIRAYGA